MKIWVDDIRTPPKGEHDIFSKWLWMKNSEDTIGLLGWAQYHGYTIKEMSLDHDLGGDDTSRPIVLWCCENDFWPVEIRVHTANPVGREWLEGMISRYKNG